jgi:hypothetical protein
MWTKSHSIVTKGVTKEQMWKLFADVNNWQVWKNSIAFSKLEGKFEKGNHFMFQPKGGPKLKIGMTVKGILGFLWVKIVAQKIVDGLPMDMQEQIKVASKL